MTIQAYIVCGGNWTSDAMTVKIGDKTRVLRRGDVMELPITDHGPDNPLAIEVEHHNHASTGTPVGGKPVGDLKGVSLNRGGY